MDIKEIIKDMSSQDIKTSLIIIFIIIVSMGLLFLVGYQFGLQQINENINYICEEIYAQRNCFCLNN